MPKQQSKLELNNFAKGLITERSVLNSEANSFRTVSNFDLNRDGTITRRRGIAYEPSFVERPILYSDSIEPFGYKWNSVNGDPSLNFLVVQYSNVLYFYNLSLSPLSNAGYLGSLTLTGYPVDKEYSITSVEGILIVTGGVDTFGVVDYNPTSNTFNFTTGRIKTRDLWGIEIVESSPERATELDPTLRPAVALVTQAYSYNLHNQSWGQPRSNDTGFYEDPVNSFTAYFGKYPSNADSVWLGLQFAPGSGGNPPAERMFPKLFAESINSGIKAARGYFIIDALRRGQSRIEEYNNNLTKYPELNQFPFTTRADFTSGGPRITCSFTGRVFFGGFEGEVIDGDARSPNFSNAIFFSQLVKNKNDIGKCYQEGDPTSRESNEIVDTDGGFIKLDGCEKQLGFIVLGSSLLVIAENGVWAIEGGGDYGFTATNYRVSKISSFGGIASRSIVEDGDKAYYWGQDGIFVITRDQSGRLVVVNLTEQSIQSYYQDIPNTSKATASGIYDPLNKTIRWLYRGGARFTDTSKTYELVLNLSLGAFMSNEIFSNVDNSCEVFFGFSSSKFSTLSLPDNVVVGTTIVEVVGNPVQTPDIFETDIIQSTRYVVVRRDKFTGTYSMSFAYYRDSLFRDWPEFFPVDAKASFLLNTITAGDSSVQKQMPMLIVHMEKTETGTDPSSNPIGESSLKMKCRWDFSNSINSAKWTNFFQAYRQPRPFNPGPNSTTFDTGFEVVTTKNRIPGNGKAMSIYGETQEQKDCRILGMSLGVTGNGTA